VALCGALCYGELASMMPRSGGEYHYLSKIYHPAYGFLSGWVSATVGFSAPVALAAMALGKYASHIINIPTEVIAVSVVVLLTAIHAYDVKVGGSFQRYSTAVKVGLIFFLILAGFLVTPNPQDISILPKETDWKMVFGSAFAVNLAFVSFAYSGWNASAYLANEIEEPKKNVPRSLFLGTIVVMLAYILLNYVFLYTVPVETFAAEQAKDFSKPIEVGAISATAIFGKIGGNIMSGMIALLLVSSISAMIFAGPRVTKAMGEDLPILNKVAVINHKGIPVLAILIQSTISIVLILTSAFDKVLFSIAFILDVFTFSTVLGLIVMRFREPNLVRTYKAWGYPITPIIFLTATGWTMYYLFTERTQSSLIAVGVMLIGLVVFFASPKNKNVEVIK
jgi:basic amino acid/polyamine antiporter, APA family